MRKVLQVALLSVLAVALTGAVASAAGGWIAADAGTTASGGVVTLTKIDENGTSYENSELNVPVENGDTITFEYQGQCGGGAPRVFIQGGAYNTFDLQEGQCGTLQPNGWYLVTGTVSNIVDGTAGHTGIVNDWFETPIRVRNLTIGGTLVDLTPLPQSKSDCKKGGFVGGGYKNQGQCVSSFARP